MMCQTQGGMVGDDGRSHFQTCMLQPRISHVPWTMQHSAGACEQNDGKLWNRTDRGNRLVEKQKNHISEHISNIFETHLFSSECHFIIPLRGARQPWAMHDRPLGMAAGLSLHHVGAGWSWLAAGFCSTDLTPRKQHLKSTATKASGKRIQT